MRVVLCAIIVSVVLGSGVVSAQGAGPDPEYYPLPCTNTVTANVVALDQSIYYNRFGAFDPNGMIYSLERYVIPEVGTEVQPGNARLESGVRPRPLVLRVNEGDCLEVTLTNLLDPTLTNNVGTRSVSFNVAGMPLAESGMIGSAVGNHALPALAPGQTATYRYYASARGSFQVDSLVSTTGGEGDGGSKAHGLFGAVVVEPAGSTWLRSQVGEAALDAATIGVNPNGTPIVDYQATLLDGTPALAILDANNEIVYSDLNAIIADVESLDCTSAPPSGTCGEAYREFVVIFHDEIAIRQAYPELKNDVLFHGVRDGFAINYGSGGLGAEVIAVRNGEGPGKDCGECKFEEFFLESWVNGDPAMPTNKDPITGESFEVTYSDDPSNVHHSYIGDPVRFENLHVGAETHVFHLHAHQWLYAPEDENSTYLDSQSISPGTSYSYEINYKGGNRNLMPGDSIFHCHLYPHFAQGMWSLWRTHDVFEDGHVDRNLPDAEISGGTPNVAIVPVPGRVMPPKPSNDLPGYPFFIAGNPGRRTPQPPMDIDHDGGLPRSQILSSTWTDGPAAIAPHYFSDPVHQRVTSNNPAPNLLAFARRIDTAVLEFLPDNGTPLEQKAMDYHAGQYNPDSALGPAVPITTDYGWPAVGYPSFDSNGNPGYFLVNGLPPQPGAPYSDPCPPTFVDGNGTIRQTPHRTYEAAYIQFDMTINQYGWHDRQARIAVLNHDVFPTLDGTRSPQPLFFRANSGDCITFKATNLMPANLNVDDYQIFTPTDIVGQHIHLVKFDVTSSDGAGNGWNYEDGTFAPEEVRERIHANNAHVDPDGDGIPDNPGTILTATAHPFFGSGPNDEWLGAQTTVQRWWADPVVNNAGYDRTIRSVFTHDHFGPSSHQQHGLYALLVVEPTDSIWTMPDGLTIMGNRSDGGPTNWAANIITGFNGEGSMREFVFETGDFMPTYDLSNLPVNAPGGVNNPEAISTSGGTVTINYRNDPIGQPFDNTAAYGLSFAGNGDPYTFVGKAYPGDKIKISLAHGAQEGQHSFGVHGARWLQEPANPNSGLTDMQQYGISEHFEMYFDLGDGLRHKSGPDGQVDYLVGGLNSGDLRNGMYGFIRSYETLQPDLAMLPGNTNFQSRPTHPLRLGTCPVGPDAPPIKNFSIQAWRAADLLGSSGLPLSEKFGFHDPNGLVFIHADEVTDVISGTRELEPLVLRVNAGDCIEVTLQNMLPPTLLTAPNANTGSSRVSLHPQMLSYDMGVADGAAVGKNIDTTVGPGETSQFAWYAGEISGDEHGDVTWTPIEFGVTNLRSYGDQEGHYTHGLYGVCVVEPEGATWVDPTSGAPARGAQADILDGNGDLLYRELVLQWMDDMPLATRNGIPMGADVLRNFEGFNYKTEPLWARMGVLSPTPWVPMRVIDQTWTLSSTQPLVGCGGLPCGDPETPLLEVEAGTPVMFRVAQAAGQIAEPGCFTVSGHQWQTQPWTDGSTKIGYNPTSQTIGTQGNITAGTHDNLLTVAGGPARAAGDYIYRAANNFDYSGGAWGIFRVTPYERVPAEPCTDLVCDSAADGVSLSWLPGGADYLGVEVYRDGALVANLDPSQTTYDDMGLAPGSYQYDLIAVNADLPSTPVTCTSSVTPYGVSSLSCAEELGVITLAWTTPPEVAGYDAIELERNGLPVASLPSTATGFQDIDAGFGTHEYTITCIITGLPSAPATCTSAIVPPSVSGLSVSTLDPCAGTMLATWTNDVPFESIAVRVDDATVATLPGTATSANIALPLGTSGTLCVVGFAGGLPAPSSCIPVFSPPIEPFPVGNLTCVTDPVTLVADLDWVVQSDYAELGVLLDGALVATLPGNATAASIVVGYGARTLEIVGTTICGEAIMTASCTSSVAPPEITALSSTLVDPCTRDFALTWSSSVLYDSIDVALDGISIATLAGDASTYALALPTETGELCVRGTIAGLDSLITCATLSAPAIPATGASDLAISVDEASLSVTATWTNHTDLTGIDVLIDGTPVATLGGTETTVTVGLVASGEFILCVGGTTICGDTLPTACASAIAPVTFRRGDGNFDLALDITDVITGLQVIFVGQSHLCYDALDANDDGGVDVTDPITILHHLFLGASPPVGSAACSADLSSDALDCTIGGTCP